MQVIQNILNWIFLNKEWLFSGVAVAIVGSIIAFLINRNRQSDSSSRSRKREDSLLSIDEIRNLAEINKFHAELNRQASEQLKTMIAEKEKMEQTIVELDSEIAQSKAITNEQKRHLANAMKERDRLVRKVDFLREKLDKSEQEKTIFQAEIRELQKFQITDVDSDQIAYVQYDSSYMPPAPIVNLKIKSPYVNKLGEVEVTMLLDTGADISVLPAKVINDLETQVGAKLPFDTVSVQDFNGKLFRQKTYRLTIDSFMGKDSVIQSIVLSFLLVDAEHGLLGRDFLNQYDICFEGTNSRFRIIHNTA